MLMEEYSLGGEPSPTYSSTLWSVFGTSTKNLRVSKITETTGVILMEIMTLLSNAQMCTEQQKWMYIFNDKLCILGNNSC